MSRVQKKPLNLSPPPPGLQGKRGVSGGGGGLQATGGGSGCTGGGRGSREGGSLESLWGVSRGRGGLRGVSLQFHEKTPREKSENGGGRGKKERAKFWTPHPSGPQPLGPHTPDPTMDSRIGLASGPAEGGPEEGSPAEGGGGVLRWGVLQMWVWVPPDRFHGSVCFTAAIYRFA